MPAVGDVERRAVGRQAKRVGRAAERQFRRRLDANRAARPCLRGVSITDTVSLLALATNSRERIRRQGHRARMKANGYLGDGFAATEIDDRDRAG